jgi:zinc transporter ZupT
VLNHPFLPVMNFHNVLAALSAAWIYAGALLPCQVYAAGEHEYVRLGLRDGTLPHTQPTHDSDQRHSFRTRDAGVITSFDSAEHHQDDRHIRSQPDRPMLPGASKLSITTDHAERKVNVSDVFWMTLVMAAACGLGAVPFFFIENISSVWAGMANAVACGVMLAASFDLLHEAEGYQSVPLVFGLVAGCLFIKVMQDWLHQYEDVKFEGFSGANAQKILLFIGIMAAHAVGEGAGVGVSFCGRRGWAHGLLVTLAIGLHNIPEGLAVATVLVARGTTPRKAMEWTLLCALPQPLFAVPSYIFVDSFRALLPASMGFAAGCMIWIVIAELLPDALEALPAGSVASAVTLSATTLEGLRMMLATLEQPDGSLAASLSGNVRIIMRIVSTSMLSLPITAMAGIALTFMAGGGSANAFSSGPKALWLGALAVGVQAGCGGLNILQLLVAGQQRWYVTCILALVGVALVLGLLMHQAQMLKELFGTSDVHKRTVDIEAGVLEQHASELSWDVLSASSKFTSNGNGLSSKSSPDLQPLHPHATYVHALEESKDKRTVTPGNLARQRPVAALMCLLCGTGADLIQGWKIAEAAAMRPVSAAADIVPFLLIRAAPLGFIAAGLAPQLLGPGAKNVLVLTLVMSGVLTATVAVSTLRYPVGVSTPLEVEFDPNHWIEKTSAILGGSTAAAALFGLWPCVKAMGASRRTPVVALGVGICVEILGALVHRLVCLNSRHCI